MTSRRLGSALALALLVTLTTPGAAAAQTKADAFAGKIPPVSGQLYRKAGRVELSVTGDLSLNDAFHSKRFAGLKLGYHFTESLSAAVHGSTGQSVPSGSAVVCSATSGCREASQVEMRQVPGRITSIVGAELAWAPVYGKLNVLASQVAHFDLSILAGPDLIAHDEVLDGEAARLLERDGGAPPSKSTIGGHVGLSARVFLTEWVAARFEVRDYLYFVKVPSGGSGNDLQNQFFTELGFSFFLPMRNRPLR